MSIIGDIRKFAGNPKLNWQKGTAPTIIFERNGVKYTIVRRAKGYVLNIGGEPRTPFWIFSTWATIKKRMIDHEQRRIVRKSLQTSETTKTTQIPSCS
jgi:hypothetical protein